MKNKHELIHKNLDNTLSHLIKARDSVGLANIFYKSDSEEFEMLVSCIRCLNSVFDRVLTVAVRNDVKNKNFK